MIYKKKSIEQPKNIFLTINYQYIGSSHTIHINTYYVNFTKYENDGWIIAPLTFDKNIFQNDIPYLVSNKDNLLCDNNIIWGMSDFTKEDFIIPTIDINISGSGCTHSFIPPEHQSAELFIKYKTEKIIFSIILGIELLILLIVGSRKYLKLAITQNFFDMQFIAVLILCIGISIASYTYLNTLTAEHVLRIIIGSQICILSLLLFRKYNISSKLSKSSRRKNS